VSVQLIATIAFGAVVSYSLFTIQHAQELSEKQRDDVDVAATNKKRVISYIKADYRNQRLRTSAAMLSIVGIKAERDIFSRSKISAN